MELSNGGDYVWLFLLAAVLGGVGGLVFELLQTRRGQTGQVEQPWKPKDARYRDWGVWANMIIGAVAAVAALWVFPPEVRTVVEGTTTTSTTHYDIVDLVGLSLIIGSAGSSFLSALQARAFALVKDQQANTTRAVAEDQIDGIVRELSAGTDPVELIKRAEAARSAVRATDSSGQRSPLESEI